MQRRFSRSITCRTVATLILCLLLAAPLVGAADQPADLSRLTLERIFENKEFSVERYGPARWLADGSGYTTLETSPDFEDARDIIRYAPSSRPRRWFRARTPSRSKSTTTNGRRMVHSC